MAKDRMGSGVDADDLILKIAMVLVDRLGEPEQTITDDDIIAVQERKPNVNLKVVGEEGQTYMVVALLTDEELEERRQQ